MSATIFVPVGGRPNKVQVVRNVVGATSNTGESVTTATTIYAALPCLIDALVDRGKLASVGEGLPMVEMTHTLFADGIKVSGYAAGASVTARGQNLVVSANQRGAFPDIKMNDKIVAEDGRTFLVLAVQFYYDVYPSLQAELAFGKGPA